VWNQTDILKKKALEKYLTGVLPPPLQLPKNMIESTQVLRQQHSSVQGRYGGQALSFLHQTGYL
jgi:hypothetical protein